MRRTASAVVALGLLAPASSAGAGQAAQYELARIGGNIAPFTVRIAADGDVTSSGAVDPTKSHVSAAARAAIAAVVTKERFFSLPTRIECPGSLPDFAANGVTVKSGTRKHSVAVRGSCNLRFRRVYNAIARATGVDTI